MTKTSRTVRQIEHFDRGSTASGAGYTVVPFPKIHRALFVSLPRFVRALARRLIMPRPAWGKRFGGTVAVSAVGMFGSGSGWGIPLAPSTLMVTIGGIGERPVVADDGRVESHQFLSLTVTVDHDIVDGAPAARFTHRLRQLIETAHGLESAQS